MNKIGLLFSGQGSQYQNMGVDFYEKYDMIKKLYKKASEIFEFDVIGECKTGEKFHKTDFSQPCIFTLSLAIFELLKAKNFYFDGVCGFSLGECMALYGADIVDLDNIIQMVNLRSKQMQIASENGAGSMMAVLGLSGDKIKDVLGKIDGYCIPVNYNCPGQIVVAGDTLIIDTLEIPLKEAGAKRCVKLPVAGAFHTRYMEDAGNNLKNALALFPYSTPKKDFYTNINAEKLEKIENLGEHMKKQMTSPVLFETQILNMIKDGYTTFIEIGAGNTLAGFVKRISKDVTVMNISKIEDFERITNQ